MKRHLCLLVLVAAAGVRAALEDGGRYDIPASPPPQLAQPSTTEGDKDVWVVSSSSASANLPDNVEVASSGGGGVANMLMAGIASGGSAEDTDVRPEADINVSGILKDGARDSKKQDAKITVSKAVKYKADGSAADSPNIAASGTSAVGVAASVADNGVPQSSDPAEANQSTPPSGDGVHDPVQLPDIAAANTNVGGKPDTGSSSSSVHVQPLHLGPQGLFPNIMAALLHVLLGLCFCFLCPVGLWLTEVFYVRSRKKFSVGKKRCQHSNSKDPSPGNDGRLVYFCGPAASSDIVEDTVLTNVKNGSCLFLVRNVEIHQFVAQSGDDGTVCTSTWATKESAQFGKLEGFEGRVNGNQSVFEALVNEHNVMVSDGVYVDKYHIPKEVLVGHFEEFKPELVDMTEQNLPDEAVMKLQDMSPVVFKRYGIYMQSSEDATMPDNGDIRISWSIVESPCKVSALGEQVSSDSEKADLLGTGAHYSIKPYNVVGCGAVLCKTNLGSLLKVVPGIYTKKEMFKHDKWWAIMTNWVVRCVAYFIILVGSYLLSHPIFMPLIYGVSDDMYGIFASGVVAVFGAFVVCWIAIFLANVAYEPILTGLCLGISVLAFSVILGINYYVKYHSDKHPPYP